MIFLYIDIFIIVISLNLVIWGIYLLQYYVLLIVKGSRVLMINVRNNIYSKSIKIRYNWGYLFL